MLINITSILNSCFLIWGYEQVLKKKPDFREKPWPSITSSAQDFVKKLLVKDPHMRLTAAQALCTQLFSVLISDANAAIGVAKSFSRARQEFLIEFTLEK